MYIRYHEAERLFIMYPVLKSMLESLQICLQTSIERDSLDEDIYELCVGSHAGSTSIPTVGNISDKTGNVAINYNKNLKITQKELKRDILLLSSVIQRINVARHSFSKLQAIILESYYWGERETWQGVVNEIKEKSPYTISIRQAKEERKKAINKIVSTSKITIDDYNLVLKLNEGEQ